MKGVTNSTRRARVCAQVLQRDADAGCYICRGKFGPLLPPGTKAVNKHGKVVPHPLSAVVDEVVPRAKGGNPYDANNCRAAHRICNELKGAGSVADARKKIASRAPWGCEWAGRTARLVQW